jgi:hypothetical protein
MISINYQRIGKAIEVYSGLGYNYIEVPWLIDQKSIDITKPPKCRYFATEFGHLIASGEQSFLQIRDELCPSRKYQTVTPCFRDDTVDELHVRQFMKLELIVPLWKTDDAEKILQQMMGDAQRAMWGCGPIEVVNTDPMTYDFTIRDIEVGSYGIREHQGFRWIYGTGMAEPRMSQAIEKHRIMCGEEDDIEMRSVMAE